MVNSRDGAIGTTTLGAKRGRERSIIVAVAIVIAAAVGLYLGLRASGGGTGTLLPYQMLARDLVQSDQEIFTRLRQCLLDAEALRARQGSWPEPDAVASLPTSPIGASGAGATSAGGGASYTWTLTQQHIIVNYLRLPSGDASASAWLIRVQEPDPAAPTDSAPNDEEHHRLPDGTVLHVSIWTHRFGSQLTRAFLPKPELVGWTQILTAPLSPLGPPLRKS
jgi:hypothetical protein